MSGKGVKNKQGTSGKVASQQLAQAFADNRPTQRKPQNRKLYDLLVDDVPYQISTEAFTYNDEQRFYVSVNGGDEHIFTWDPDLKRLTAIDEDAATWPESLEEAINNRLQQELK
ncbi:MULTISPECIES: hypothetical protein [Niastella]|uniref:Uncharacterized protein n=1 Tax=Niastella soli TaxID=2821487 RepID=A0ABS3Z173_9BACT|nr:hypothetical protein [Niastella soli]MBO9203924.1 hypothetical protein [Niastella soli]